MTRRIRVSTVRKYRFRGSSGGSSPTPPAAPSISAFAFSDMAIDEDVSGTFTATIGGGTLTNWSLDPGDGSAPYTGSGSSISQAHTYADAGTYDAILTATGPGGSDFETVLDIVVSAAAGSVDFQEVTTLKATAANAWVTPFGIPVARGINVNSTRRGKMFAQISGTKYPIQTEKFIERADGNLHWCAGHLKMPTGVSPGTKVSIGYSDTESVPSGPNWTTIWSGGHDLVINTSEYEPVVFWLAFPDTGATAKPVGGDVLSVTLTDDIGSQTFTYRFDCNYQFGGFADERPAENRAWYNFAKLIQTTPGSRWQTAGDPAVPFRVWNRPVPPGYDAFAPRFANSVVINKMGYPFGDPKATYSDMRPRHSLGSSGIWPSDGFYIWPTRPAGNPAAATCTFSITRNGTRLPVVNANPAGHPYVKLNYDAQTENFIEQTYVVGATSGACGYILTVIDSGSTGTLRLLRTKGDFIDNEALTAIDAFGTPVAGSATANGTQVWQTVTSSSGGTALLHAVTDNPGQQIHVTNITGSFNNGDTLTFETGSPCVMNGSAIASAFVLCPTHTTSAQSGTLTALSTAANRVDWTASFDEATETADSPWFDGPLVQQKERRMKLKRVSDNAAHPDLEAWFRVSKDKDGNIVHQEVSILNPDLAGKPRDYWYDAEVLVGGVSQTSGDAARYQHLFHQVFASWRWRAAKTFGMSDPGDFMKARCIFPWKRYPTWDVLPSMDAKVRGKQINSGDNLVANTVSPYAKATRNDPLHPSNLDFSGLGGARGELGDYNSWEHFFWAGDSIAAWPAMEAFADNCAGAYGLHVIDSGATGDDVGGPPNLYLRHQYRVWLENASFNRPSGPSAGETITQLYRLKRPFSPANSHSPTLGTFSAYLACPEKRFLDLQEGMSYYLHCSTQSGGKINSPKTGGVAGDPDHILGYQHFNGERTYARPAKEIFKISALQHVGARRRTYWRRAAQDMANHANNMASRTIWGAFHMRDVTRDSNNVLPTSWLPGEAYVNNIAPNGGPKLDYFKSAYISMTIWMCKDWNAANVDDFIQQSIWPMLLYANPPHGEPWRALPSQASGSPFYFVSGATWDGSTYAVPGSPTIWSDTDMSGLKTFIESATTSAQKNDLAVNYSLAEWTERMSPGETNYNLAKQTYGAYLAYVTYGTNPTLVTVAQNAMDYMDTAAPIDTPYFGFEYAQFQQQIGFIPYANVTNW